MIVAYINKKVAYPAVQSNIKIVLQNPFIKEGDEKTMEVSFPLRIPENREVFGALNRIDTTFETEDYEDCRIIADGLTVIQGTGTITSITEDEVKIQVLAGKSYLRYKASFDDIFIDRLDYGQILPRHQYINAGNFVPFDKLDLTPELNSQGFIGDPGRYAYMPVHDEDNDFWCNQLAFCYAPRDEFVGTTIARGAIQPNLMMVMNKVLSSLGYTMGRNEFDKDPWNKIYICSAKITNNIAAALPHWSCYKFLDEFRKLFNAVFLFDEVEKKVDIVPFGESGNNGEEYIEPLEGFTSSYEKEGLQYLGSSNLEYKLSECERTEDVVNEELLKAFDKREYDDINQLYRDFEVMSVKDKLTTVFHCPVGWFYGIPITQEENEDEPEKVTGYLLKECGWFSPLIRREGASKVELNIVPVAMMKCEARCLITNAYNWFNQNYCLLPIKECQFETLIANINCEDQSEDCYFGVQNSKEVDYVTVQDVMELGESLPSGESDDSQMEIFFVTGVKTKVIGEVTVMDEWISRWFPYIFSYPAPPNSIYMPTPFTDYRHAIFDAQVQKYSLAFNPMPGITSIGGFHNKGVKIKRNINGNNEINIKFLFDGKPDPRKIYVIRNRKFICSKIEMTVNEKGIDRVKTGYFYEML